MRRKSESCTEIDDVRTRKRSLSSKTSSNSCKLSFLRDLSDNFLCIAMVLCCIKNNRFISHRNMKIKVLLSSHEERDDDGLVVSDIMEAGSSQMMY